MRLAMKMKERQEVQGGDVDFGVPVHLVSRGLYSDLECEADNKE
jgi:hypothetical protein